MEMDHEEQREHSAMIAEVLDDVERADSHASDSEASSAASYSSRPASRSSTEELQQKISQMERETVSMGGLASVPEHDVPNLASQLAQPQEQGDAEQRGAEHRGGEKGEGRERPMAQGSTGLTSYVGRAGMSDESDPEEGREGGRRDRGAAEPRAKPLSQQVKPPGQETGAEGGGRQEKDGGWGPPTEASIQQEAKGGQESEEDTREARLRAAGLVELRFVDPRPTDQLTYVADSNIICAVEQLLEDGMIEMPEGRLMAAQGPPQTRRDGKICEWDVSVSVEAEEYLRAMAAVYVLDEGEDPVELLIVGKAQRVAELEVIEGATRAERAARHAAPHPVGGKKQRMCR